MTQTLLLLTVLGLVGCASVGPGTVTRDRFDYTEAVAESWKSQMLLNLVTLRYGDTPVFPEVGQIISGYTVEGTLSAAGTITSAHGVVPGVPDSSVLLGAPGRDTDRPTITYAPLVGERFARLLMTPLPPSAILRLIQAEYPVDAVLRLTVHEVNGIRNRYGSDLRARNLLKGPLLSCRGLDMHRWRGKGRACTLAVHENRGATSTGSRVCERGIVVIAPG